MICVFSHSVALHIQELLWLEEVPDFSLVRNCKLSSQWTTLFPSNEGTPMDYTHYTFNSQIERIYTMLPIWENTIRWKKKVIRIPSNKQVLAVPYGVWVHRKYL